MDVRMLQICLTVVLAIGLTNAVEIAYTNVSQENTGLFSNDIKLEFALYGEKVEFNLQENSHMNNVPLFIGNNGEIKHIQQDLKTEIKAYTDVRSGATAVTRRTSLPDGSYKTEYRASFVYHGGEASLEPVTEAESVRTIYNHKVCTSLALEEPLDHDGVIRPEVKAKVEDMRKMKGQKMLLPSSFEKANYGVEMLLCLDYPIYKRWLDETGDTDKAIANIQFFYVHVVNKIDSRYMSIDETDFAIYVRLQAIYIAKTTNDSPWTEVSKYPGGARGYYTDAYDALDAFEVWINKPEVEDTLGPFDQATLFTGYKLIGGFRDDGSPRPIGGLADIWGICEYRRASVNQENGQYATIQTGAHEMGHNLGALHDGNKDNTCLSKDQFIMAISPGNLDKDNFYNTFTFSSCSREYFRDWLSYLTLSEKNCLLNDAETGVPGWDDELKTPPGQKYDFDAQCVHQAGKGSFYCAGGDNDAEMCDRLDCYDTETGQCEKGVERRAYIGTTCGNSKWCDENYACKYDADAPAAKDRCLSGDYRLKVISETRVERTCKELGEEEPYDCYKRHNSTCCQTCADIRDDSKPGCEYGDHSPYCDIKLRDCYSENTLKSCCATCQPIEGAPEGCDFGDRASWCDTMNPGGCYTNRETCCKTCFDTADPDNPDCPWGDRASWCVDMKARDCYELETTCCGHCEQFHSGTPGCEYGDRMVGCNERDCANRDMWKKCCHTCQAEISECEGGDDATWCETSHSSICYDSWHICCDTCKKRYTGDKDCPFGDHYSWCPGYVDSNPGICDSNKEVASDCCKTCDL